MIECGLIAAEKWDTELNYYYKALMIRLNQEQQELLSQSQRKWIAFRDAEFSFSSSYYSDGTMWRIVDASTCTDFIRSRTLQLKEDLDSMQ